MFELVLIHQSEEKAGDMQQAWEQPGVRLRAYDAWAMDPEALDDCRQALLQCDFAVILLHGGLSWFPDFQKLFTALSESRRFFFHSEIEEENQLILKKSSLLQEEQDFLRSCFEMGGVENFKKMLVFFQTGERKEPQPVIREGIFGCRPDQEAEVLAQAENCQKPVVGVLVHYSNCLSGNTGHIEALVDAIRRKGGFPLPIVSTMQPTTWSDGLLGVIERYFQMNGRPRIQALIATSGFSMTLLASPGMGRHGETGSVFARLGVPVLQAMVTYLSQEKWEQSFEGMDSMSVGSSVFEPELDGQIITTVIGCTEKQQGEHGSVSRTVPLPAQIDLVAGLAVSWGRLQVKSASEKKVAILLHNMPPRRDMLGCAYGLDAPESACRMIRSLQEKGLFLQRSWENGAELLRELLNGLTNENDTLSYTLMREKSAGVLAGRDYEQWFAGFPEHTRKEMEERWGQAPGEWLVLDQQILIPGIQNGNLFVGIQPARETEQEAEAACHSLKRPCPHQYLGYYKWIRDVFHADIIYHVGAHGTVEWLPGKALGLSADCYPELCLRELPNVYPYIVNLPGEGTQAKRRAAAVLIGHMPPPMKQAGLYGALEELSVLLEQYRNAEKYDKKQLAILEEELQKKAEALEIPKEARVSLDGLEGWLEEIRHSQIRDGLHILGKIPVGTRMEHILEFLSTGGETREVLKERLQEIPKELDAVCATFEGRFVPPGGSGCPSRDSREVLPTGRNFYGLHPGQIPGRAAWETGKKMAEELLDRMRKGSGKWPESVTMVVYSGETMKTQGDTVAEILFLLGVRPTWIAGTQSVSGLELISPGELQRPRVDVTLRVSGLFRDNFPNLIELLDDAVNLVIAQEEPIGSNYVREHVMRNIRTLVASGMEKEKAVRVSSARIFGCPPGQYGAGVAPLIESGAWKDRGELGESYIKWGGFSYGRNRSGEAMEEAFRDRLKAGEAVVKNMSSSEEDLMESDDFYNYFGGAVAAAEQAKGEKTEAYVFSDSDGTGRKLRTLKEETERLFRAKLLNPAFAEGMMPHGYRGAQEISMMFDTVFGWSAAADNITAADFRGLEQLYLQTPRMKEFLGKENPWALQHICERLLEVADRGMWEAEEQDLDEIRRVYLEMEGGLEDMES